MPTVSPPSSMDDASVTLAVDRQAEHYLITLDRPKVRNAINAKMVAELHAVCARIEADPAPVIITGAGHDFAAGADIGELRDRGAQDALHGINRALFDRIAALPAPVVAAVSGYALGGGAELAYACDIRFADSTAVFGNPEPGLGILAAAGATYRLRALVGESVARQVLIGGRWLDAEAAQCHGLVMPLVAPGEVLDAAQKAVKRLARQAPLALRLTKLALAAHLSQPPIDDVAQAVLFESEDKRQRMTAFLEKKKS